MRRPWFPLHPRRDDGCAIGARGGARPRRRIERLLSPPIDPRLEVLKRSAARRAKCSVVRHDCRVAHGTLLRFEGSYIGTSLTRSVASARDHICGTGARGKEDHVMDVTSQVGVQHDATRFVAALPQSNRLKGRLRTPRSTQVLRTCSLGALHYASEVGLSPLACTGVQAALL